MITADPLSILCVVWRASAFLGRGKGQGEPLCTGHQENEGAFSSSKSLPGVLASEWGRCCRMGCTQSVSQRKLPDSSLCPHSLSAAHIPSQTPNSSLGPSRWGAPEVMLSPPQLLPPLLVHSFSLYSITALWGQSCCQGNRRILISLLETLTLCPNSHSTGLLPPRMRVHKVSPLLWAGSPCFVCLLQGLVDMHVLF